MAFSIEAAIIVPTCVLIITGMGFRALHVHRNVYENAKREAVQEADRAENHLIYRQVQRDDGQMADVQTNPLALLKFCIYIEDQANFLREVLNDE